MEGHQFHEITLKKILSIWWSMIWRALLVSILVGAILGFIVGFTLAVAGARQLGDPAHMLLGWLGSIPVSIWALKTALSKKYGGYSVVLMKTTAASPA
jgi:Mg/Co/Ni transporter MgtE